MSGFAGASFVFCSFWVYHYIDLEHYDALPEGALEKDNTERRPNSGSEDGPFEFRANILI